MIFEPLAFADHHKTLWEARQAIYGLNQQLKIETRNGEIFVIVCALTVPYSKILKTATTTKIDICTTPCRHQCCLVLFENVYTKIPFTKIWYLFIQEKYL